MKVIKAKRNRLFTLMFFSLICTSFHVTAQSYVHVKQPLNGKIICIDPGHGGTAETDHFRVGPTGEREEWINLRVAFYLRNLLEDAGAKVILTRTTDIHIPLQERAEIAKREHSDVFISIHHNATADTNANFPILYFHGQKSENKGSTVLAEFLGESLRTYLFGGQGAVGIISDQVIFPGAGAAVLRHTAGMPALIGEASFFSHRPEEHRLKDTLYNKLEAQAYFEALSNYFQVYDPESSKFSIVPKNSIIPVITPFKVAQEADRMDQNGKNWLENFKQAKFLVDPFLMEKTVVLSTTEHDTLQKAYDLFTNAVQFFPDSWLAGEGHTYRAQILQKLGKVKEAEMEFLRKSEHFLILKN